MNKVAVRIHAKEQYVWYWCPGCQHHHGVPSIRWKWNQSVESPTLTPSVRHYIPAQSIIPERTFCHYFIQDGQIKYCGDCEHKLSGQTVQMEEPHEGVPDNS